MREAAIRGFLWIMKWLGLFSLARFVTRRRLRILCYHGIALDDESSFRPKLFIRLGTFEKRMEYLARHQYPVLKLEDAYAGLAAGNLPDHAVVITIDDGFYSVFLHAWPVLQKHSFPSTVYVTSYYAAKQRPIFRIALQYMFWKTRQDHFDTSGLGLPVPAEVSLKAEQEKNEALWAIIHFAETSLEEPQRCALIAELGKRLEVEYRAIEASRSFGLLNAEEVHKLSRAGVDIQLHTHRHQLPEDEAGFEREILENRGFLEPLAGRSLRHLCYPSGIWSPRRWPWLESLGISTATTCEPGLNDAKTPRLGLRRFLDGENVSRIRFEAEMSGLLELWRLAKSGIRLLCLPCLVPNRGWRAGTRPS